MSLILTGVIDGPLPGGLPKAVELYVTEAIADLSIYGLGSANNGGGTDGEEFTFPAVSASAGTYIYLASEATGLPAFLGIDEFYTTSAVNINGDDAIELFENGSVIDVYGVPTVDGTGEVWDHLDGWASRKPGTAASAVFNPDDWTFSGPNALDGETTNASAATPFPIATFEEIIQDPVFTINEIDADQDSTDSAEFIEIYDGGVGGASLDGLTVVLYNGNGDADYKTISLDGFVTNDAGYFVIGSANVENVDLVAFTTNGIQNGADAVALYDGPAPAGPTTVNLLDAIVYGTDDADDVELLTALGQSTQYNESGGAGGSTADALARDPDGSGEFVAQAPTPGETNVIEIVEPVEVTLVSTIQGTAGTADMSQIGVDDASTMVGETVLIEVIVTADFQDGLFGTQGDLNGFYVQEEEIDYDFNDLSSEGIFIYDGSSPSLDVTIGDLVRITGTVSENFGQTEISASFIEIIGTGMDLPTPVDVVFPTAGVALDSSGNYVANLEAYEGMLVNIQTDMSITEMFNLDRFGQYNVAANGQQTQFTQDNAPDVAGYDAHQQEVAANTIVLDDGLSSQNPDTITVIDGNDGILSSDDSFRAGDVISNITGVVNYSFSEYRIHNATGEYTQVNPATDAPDDIGGNFKVASLNVLNYFTTIDADGAVTDNGSDPRGANSVEEFERQADKLVNAIVAMDADILGLVEIENDFAGEEFAIQDLVARVNAELGSEVYAFVDPGQEFVGGDAIANGLIYKIDGVALLGDMAILESFEGRDFIDPLGAGRGLNRPAIAQTFEDLATGQSLTVSVNHLKSKGSLSGLAADEDQGDGQGNNNATRTESADILADWLNSDPTGQGSENVLILGDLNSYAKEDPLTALDAAGFTDLAATLLGDAAYSYVFDGQTGTLDYALANDALLADLAGITEWHINSDEADAFDYNLDFGRDPSLYDGDSATRGSDHDPVIVSFNFEVNYNEIAGTYRRDYLVGTEGRDRIDAGARNDKIFGLDGDDLILAGSGRDRAYGGDGNDIIDGGRGGDRLFGGDGDDQLIAGGGRADFMWGGDGGDTFIFSESIAEDRYRDRAKILDFDADDDVIDLGGAEIDSYRERSHYVELRLDGGHDTIKVYGVSDFDDITFVEDFIFA